jgi:hypothetical protein
MYETRLNAVDRWLQGLLTWTPGQTDIIKTVALVLMLSITPVCCWPGIMNSCVCWGRLLSLFGLVWE